MNGFLKSPVIRAAGAYFLYASQLVVIQRKLKDFTPATTLLLFYVVTIPVAVGRVLWLKFTHQPVIWPSGKETFTWVTGAALAYYLADYLLISAFTEAGANEKQALSVALTGILFPVFAAMIHYVWARTWPNGWHVACFLVGVCAVLLALKGDAVETAKAAAAEAAAKAAASAAPSP